MSSFEEFLIAEFNEQHNNMRQIESSMTQMLQGFFAIEGIILAGTISLLSINLTLNRVIIIMAPIFWFLVIFGHLTYQMAIYSFVSIKSIDFQNTLTRRYFGEISGKGEYLFFISDPDVPIGGSAGDWEKVNDSRSTTAKFVGHVNAINLLFALAATIYSFIQLKYPQFNFNALTITNISITIIILIIFIVALQFIYYRIMYLRIVRLEESINIQRRHEVIKHINRDALILDKSHTM